MLKINNLPVELKKYPDGTLLIKDDNYIQDSNIIITWNYESDNEIFALICLVKHLKNKNNIISLNMPYCPNSRMDRVKDLEDVFTLKYFADIINYLNFNQVQVLDPHSFMSEALINNIIISLKP